MLVDMMMNMMIKAFSVKWSLVETPVTIVDDRNDDDYNDDDANIIPTWYWWVDLGGVNFLTGDPGGGEKGDGAV